MRRKLKGHKVLEMALARNIQAFGCIAKKRSLSLLIAAMHLFQVCIKRQ